MPDFSERCDAAFAAIAIDTDILDELALHAESTYDTLRADGVSEPEASAKVDRLSTAGARIRRRCSESSDARRQSRRRHRRPPCCPERSRICVTACA